LLCQAKRLIGGLSVGPEHLISHGVLKLFIPTKMLGSILKFEVDLGLTSLSAGVSHCNMSLSVKV
jgi:NADH:ubiquinone oxidoreductase subunit D